MVDGASIGHNGKLEANLTLKPSIIMAPIVLTKSYRLSIETQKQLKELYETVRANVAIVNYIFLKLTLFP